MGCKGAENSREIYIETSEIFQVWNLPAIYGNFGEFIGNWELYKTVSNTNLAAHCSGCVFTVCVCVFTAVCVCTLDG